MMPQAYLLATFLAAIIILVARRVRTSKGRPALLPPGPKPLPFLGNLLDIPKELPWLVYRDWSRKYGNLIGLKLPGGQTMLVLNSLEPALDLLDKRSATYSDRPKSLVVDLIGWGWNTPFLPYGEEWRRTRRASSQHFVPKVMPKHYPVLLCECRRFLRLLHAEPDRLRDLLEFSFAATTLKCMYGIDIVPGERQFIPLLHNALKGPVEALVAGRFLVEQFPLLQYVPAWVPGAGFQRKFARWRHLATELLEQPFIEAKRSWNSGEGYHSASHEMLEEITQAQLTPPQAADKERIAKIGAANVYAAGSDTTFSTLLSFFMAMAMHPDVQAKAQAELDTIVSPDRLPEHSDREALPYINAIVKEAYRWHNVLPLGVVHRSMEDDEYKGYWIPEGTLVIANIWAMMHDPTTYPRPELFEPERYLENGTLNPNAPDPANIVFGFGRRICLGRHFADASLFISVASVLHVFNITPPLDANGQPIDVEVKMSTGFFSYPSGFKCTIRPRSKSAEALLRV